MSAVHCIAAADVPPQRWRNGGGVTRELLAWPSASDWQVRLSVADIESDGPFSSFPGVQRWFAVLEGAGVQLHIDGVPHRLVCGDAPLHFDGAAATECRLIDGPTRDLNLMLRAADGRLQPALHARPWQPTGRAAGLFTAVAGVCTHGGASTALPAFALLWFDIAPATLAFAATSPGEAAAAPVGWWLAATPQETA